MSEMPISSRAIPLASGPASARHYNAVALWFHWITAGLMAIILPIAWVMTSMAENNPKSGFFFMLHKSIGLTILVIVIARLAWRATHPAPPLEDRTDPAIALLARVNHWLLYAIMLIMPVSGYALSATGKYPTTWFNLFTVPAIGPSPGLHDAAAGVHVIGQWFVYGFVLLHLLGVAYHVVVTRDGMLSRILPQQRAV